MTLVNQFGKRSSLIKYIQILLKDLYYPDLRVTEMFDEQTAQTIYRYLVDRFDVSLFFLKLETSEDIPNFSSITPTTQCYTLTYTQNELVPVAVKAYSYSYGNWVEIDLNSGWGKYLRYMATSSTMNTVVSRFCVPVLLNKLDSNQNTPNLVSVSSCYKDYDDNSNERYTLTPYIVSFLLGRAITTMSSDEDIKYCRDLLNCSGPGRFDWDDELTNRIVETQTNILQKGAGSPITGYMDLITEAYILGTRGG